MHVGIDATSWLLPRGFGRHTRCLLTALLEVDQDSQYTFFVDSREAAAAVPSAAAVRLVEAGRPTIEAATATSRRTLGDLARMSRALSSPELDVVVFPTSFTFVPVWTRAKRVVFMHDVTGETYPALALRSVPARVFWTIKRTLGRWQADQLVTVSEHSRVGLATRFNVPPEEIQVLGEASDPVFRRLEQPRATSRLEALGLTGARRLIVHVGGFSPHKNLDHLVEVFASLNGRPSLADTDLVFVGDYAHETFVTGFERLRVRVRTLGLDACVRFTGFLPDEDLVVLLNLAAVLVLPSLNEGFGLPAVEAAACGCPVVASRSTPLPDLLGAGGRYVEPTSVPQLEAALTEVLESRQLRQEMGQAGLAAAARLSWAQPARQLVDLMRSLSTS